MTTNTTKQTEKIYNNNLIKNIMEELVIKCGKNSDSFEKLEKLCIIEAEKLISKLQFSNQDTIDVPCWTSDFPELIGIIIFKKATDGKISFELDTTETTL